MIGRPYQWPAVCGDPSEPPACEQCAGSMVMVGGLWTCSACGNCKEPEYPAPTPKKSLCPCGLEPAVNGGRGFECRGRSMGAEA